jgi:hypothetical protein
MTSSTYLVFGDLHGRILPAFRLASAWSREHRTLLDGLLQVGDLGFFPDPSRLDKATKRHAEKDPLELGAARVAHPSRLADTVFADPNCPRGLWFTAGNHEDFEELARLSAGGDATTYPVDHYLRVHCLRDGTMTSLSEGLQVAALWGIDNRAPNARRKAVSRAYIRPRAVTQLSGVRFDVLLTHESGRDVIFQNSGSEEISALVEMVQPALHFFGHYSGTGRRIEGDFGASQIYHMAGMELRGRNGGAEEGSVGVLRCDEEGNRTFEYLDPFWLKTFTRHNWMHR